MLMNESSRPVGVIAVTGMPMRKARCLPRVGQAAVRCNLLIAIWCHIFRVSQPFIATLALTVLFASLAAVFISTPTG